TLVRRRHRRKIAVHVKWNDRNIESRRNFYHGPRESVAHAPLGATERFELPAFRYVEAIAVEFLQKIHRQRVMAAQGNMIFFLRLADKADVDGTVNFGAGKQTKGR